MGLELFEVHFMTLLSTDHTFTYNLPKFCKYYFKRTSAGKKLITCRRPSEKIIFLFSEGRRQEKNFTCSRPKGQYNLSMQDVGRKKSIAEGKLMFIYERFPLRVDALSSWL